MQSENQNILTSGKVLLIDSSGERISIALFEGGSLVKKDACFGGALENIFGLISSICNSCKVKISEIKTFGFCEGVGSILGIRASSNAFSVFRELSENSVVFAWSLMDAYAQILAKSNSEFSLICPSRKGYANALICKDSQIKSSEIETSQIKDLPTQIFQIPQRKITDKNFDGIEEIYFDCEQIFEALKENPKLLNIADSNEIFDAKVLAKREYVKWNSTAHS